MMTLRAMLLVLLAFHASAAAAETARNDGICDVAAQQAERKFQLPDGLLQAVARVETNSASTGEMTAWPWTVNIAGEGRWFETRRAAESFVGENRARGVESIDIGCFQINTKWHGDAFESVSEIFDAEISADYAASFLNALKKEKGDWKSAIATYHSRTPGKAKRYADKIMQAYAETKGQADFTFFPAPGAVGPGGVHLFLFRDTAPLLNAAARGPIIDRKAISPVVSGGNDGAK